MDSDHLDLIKHREIFFSALHPDRKQAHSAMHLLSDVEGIERLQTISTVQLNVSYNLTYLTLQLIEETLIEVGFHLDSHLLYKLKRALYYYTEETQRANLVCPLEHSKSTRGLFVNRYQRLQHGCRDGRPECWRKYL